MNKQAEYPRIHFADPEDKARHDRMVVWVERMLALQQGLEETGEAQTALQQAMAETERLMDELVYER